MCVLAPSLGSAGGPLPRLLRSVMILVFGHSGLCSALLPRTYGGRFLLQKQMSGSRRPGRRWRAYTLLPGYRVTPTLQTVPRSMNRFRRSSVPKSSLFEHSRQEVTRRIVAGCARQNVGPTFLYPIELLAPPAPNSKLVRTAPHIRPPGAYRNSTRTVCPACTRRL